MGWAIIALALLGNYLVIKKSLVGFCCWLVTNAYFAYRNFSIGEFPQAALSVVYFVLCIYGIRSWKKKNE